MKLPEPAATIWRKHREAIRRAATGPDGPSSETMLGGGTTMAARLGHRGSTDIDVFAPDLPHTENAERGGRYPPNGGRASASKGSTSARPTT